jgi:hypothetical protein
MIKHIFKDMKKNIIGIKSFIFKKEVKKYICEDVNLQPIECEKHGSCKNCPHYVIAKPYESQL